MQFFRIAHKPTWGRSLCLGETPEVSKNMAGLELLSDQGYRIDGRKATELRKVQARMGVFAQADGSAYLEQGNTKALAVVYGPHEVSGSPAARAAVFVGLSTGATAWTQRQ